MTAASTAVSVRPSAAERVRPLTGRRTVALAAMYYLLAALAVTLVLWRDPASRTVAGNPNDADQFAWFFRYDATAIAHARLPDLVTTAMNAPRGVNVMWNTFMLLPGMLLAPVTLLFGPQASLTLLMTAGFAGSATAMFAVLRRWQVSVAGAALGAAVYGFSPALLHSAIGHYDLQFAVLPPLIVDAGLRLATGRARAVRGGIRLGLLVTAQVFITEEILFDTALAGMLMAAVLAVSRPRQVASRVKTLAAGLGVAACVTAVIAGYPLWVQFYGPLSQQGSPFAADFYKNDLAGLVVPSSLMLFHTAGSAAAAARFQGHLPEYLGYLGWPLLVVLVAAAIRYWRDPRVRATAATWAVLELFSLGGTRAALPWHWLQGLPALSQVLPDRFAIVADGAAAAALAFSLDLARSAAPQTWGWQRRGWPFAVVMLALLPMIPRPLQAGATPPVPVGWQAAFARLGPDARVLVVPVPDSHTPEAMRWQADTGEPASLMGGWFVGPGPAGKATSEYWTDGPTNAEFVAEAGAYLDSLWGTGPPKYKGIPHRQIDTMLAYWRPTAVVAVTSPGSRLARVLSGIFGRPAFGVGQVLVWRR